jgi:small subunit ribosomal protein S16
VAARIRLSRVGSAKNPIYRIVVADALAPRDGRFIEIIGQYNPRTDPSVIDIDLDKAAEWLKKGAQPTQTVKKLLSKKGIKA